MCPHLANFGLEKTSISKTNRLRERLHNLKSLTIIKCSSFCFNSIFNLVILSSLENLEIIDCQFNELEISMLVTICSKLSSLGLGTYFSTNFAQCGDAFAKILVNSCKQLKILNLSSISLMSEIGMMEILNSYSKQLTTICIRRAYNVPPQILSRIQEFNNLKCLTLAHLYINDDSASTIINEIGGNLFFLFLDTIFIGDQTIRLISKKCINLQQLRLYNIQDFTDFRILLSSEYLKKLRILIINSCPLLVYGSLTDIKLSLFHLELVNCDFLEQETIYQFLSRLNSLKKFVYVGYSLSLKNRDFLRSKTSLVHEIYTEK